LQGQLNIFLSCAVPDKYDYLMWGKIWLPSNGAHKYRMLAPIAMRGPWILYANVTTTIRDQETYRLLAPRDGTFAASSEFHTAVSTGEERSAIKINDLRTFHLSYVSQLKRYRFVAPTRVDEGPRLRSVTQNLILAPHPFNPLPLPLLHAPSGPPGPGSSPPPSGPQSGTSSSSSSTSSSSSSSSFSPGSSGPPASPADAQEQTGKFEFEVREEVAKGENPVEADAESKVEDATKEILANLAEVEAEFEFEDATKEEILANLAEDEAEFEFEDATKEEILANLAEDEAEFEFEDATKEEILANLAEDEAATILTKEGNRQQSEAKGVGISGKGMAPQQSETKQEPLGMSYDYDVEVTCVSFVTPPSFDSLSPTHRQPAKRPRVQMDLRLVPLHKG